MGFKENLKSELIYKGMLVKELAASAGISKHTIDNYLSVNSYTPSAENAVKIARVLGVSVEYLVTGSETCREKTLLSLTAETRTLVQAVEDMDVQDRKFILGIVDLLKNRGTRSPAGAYHRTPS
jgi:transcriptional regulator with XRE-family HTH domain